MSEENKTKNITLGEHLGLWLAKEKTVQFRPWKGRQTRELAEILHRNRAKMEGQRFCKRVSIILSYMCTEIGGAKFFEPTDKPGEFKELMSEQERFMHIRQMWHVDVLAAYFLLRIATVDEFLELPFLSPYDPDGKRTVLWKGDLSQLPFIGEQGLDKNTYEFHLKNTAIVRGKEVNKLIWRPLKWATFEDVKFVKPGATDLKQIAGALYIIPEISDQPLPWAIEDLDDFSKRDLSALTKAMEDKHTGLDFSVEVHDSVAERSFEASIPWMHPDFFDTSSE